MKREEMKIRLDYNNMLDEFVGEHGVSLANIEAIGDKIAAAKKAMADKRPAMAWRDLPYSQNDVLPDLLAYAQEMRPKIDALVVFGIGGSALGPLAVHQAINGAFWNDSPALKRRTPPLYRR